MAVPGRWVHGSLGRRTGWVTDGTFDQEGRFRGRVGPWEYGSNQGSRVSILLDAPGTLRRDGTTPFPVPPTGRSLRPARHPTPPVGPTHSTPTMTSGSRHPLGPPHSPRPRRAGVEWERRTWSSAHTRLGTEDGCRWSFDSPRHLVTDSRRLADIPGMYTPSIRGPWTPGPTDLPPQSPPRGADWGPHRTGVEDPSFASSGVPDPTRDDPPSTPRPHVPPSDSGLQTVGVAGGPRPCCNRRTVGGRGSTGTSWGRSGSSRGGRTSRYSRTSSYSRCSTGCQPSRCDSGCGAPFSTPTRSRTGGYGSRHSGGSGCHAGPGPSRRCPPGPVTRSPSLGSDRGDGTTSTGVEDEGGCWGCGGVERRQRPGVGPRRKWTDL